MLLSFYECENMGRKAFGLKGLTYRDLHMLLGGEFSYVGRFGHFKKRRY